MPIVPRSFKSHVCVSLALSALLAGPAVAATHTFTYSGPSVAIPDNGPQVAASLPVSGVVGSITSVTLSFPSGPPCGLTHSFMGDVVLSLQAPTGSDWHTHHSGLLYGELHGD